MTKGRIEAFSDGMFAIIITVMVMEIHMPKMVVWADFMPLLPAILSYALCFIITGAYWINHHHMFQTVQRIGGGVLWANLHMLFWLSLMPFFTGVIGDDDFNGFTTIFFAFEFMMCAISYFLLVLALRAEHGKGSPFDQNFGANIRGKLNLIGYVLAFPLSFILPRAALVLIAILAVAWIVPDRRFVTKTLND